MTEGQAVAFRFHKASCVVAGTFNMYILHPKWLASHGLIEQGTEVVIETNLNRPGFRFQLPKHKTVWSVSPNRLVVETDDPARDCGEVAGKVLEVLPHTPLFGLGNNVVYQADLSIVEDLAPNVRNFRWPEPSDDYEAIAQRTFHVAVKRKEYEFTNVQLSLTDSMAELACNVHTKLEDRSDASEAAVAAARRFFEDRTRSKVLAQHLLATSIEYDSDNP